MGYRLFFRPWVGENYLDGFSGARILVLGASHYCNSRGACEHFDECTGGKHGCPERDWLCPDYAEQDIANKRVSRVTINEINNFLDPDSEYNDFRAYYRFTHWILGHSPEGVADKIGVWDYVAFSNIYQYPLPQWTTPQGEIKDFVKIVGAIIDDATLPDYPDVIIVWGAVVRDNFLEKIDLEQVNDNIYIWKNVDGKDIVLLFMTHPSFPKFFRQNRALLGEAIGLAMR